MRISDWSSDVCSSDLHVDPGSPNYGQAMEQQHGPFGMTSARTLRLAKSSECGSLSALALRSKAYWGYDSAFLQACRDDLTGRTTAAAAGRVVGLIEQETPLRFYALAAGDRRDRTSIVQG